MLSFLSHTVPCPPTSVTVVNRNMENATLVRVSWSTVTCSAVQYLAELKGQFLSDPLALVQVASYWTEQTYFEFLVPCSILYSVVVTAGSGAGNGVPSFAVNGSTGTILNKQNKKNNTQVNIVYNGTHRCSRSQDIRYLAIKTIKYKNIYTFNRGFNSILHNFFLRKRETLKIQMIYQA